MSGDTEAAAATTTSAAPGMSRRSLGALFFARILTNMSFRLLYPFLPAVARGLGVSLTAAGQLASVQGGVRVFAPFFGGLSDRYGRRRVMQGALVVVLLAAVVVGLSRSYVVALLAFAAIGLARAVFDPTVHAYIGDAVPYARRGRPFAAISMAWALSWLIGVPAAGFAIERARWNVPWLAIAALLVAAIVGLRLFVPRVTRGARPSAAAGSLRATPLSWLGLLRRPPVLAATVVGFGIIFAVENVLIVYGAFLDGRFGLSVSAIGLLSIVTGASELLAEGTSFFWTDRLGKKRSVTLGLLVFAGALFLLPRLGQSVALSLAGFSLVFFCFEYTIVSFFPLMSEVAPDARATSLSLNVAAMGLARFMAPTVATLLFTRAGTLLPNALLSAAVCLVTAALARRWLPA